MHSTGRELSKVDFPGNDDAERPGWDGVVEAAEGTPWVPAGRSGWEFGTNEDPKAKADGDFDKSVKALTKKERLDTTFVFVTPRRWSGKNAWLTTQRAKRLWADVRVFDASDIEQWLEQSVPGQAWFANETQLPANDVRSLDKCWADWSNVSRPPLPGSLFNPAIEAAKRTVASRLSKPGEKPLLIAADSIEEALAFLAQLLSERGGAELAAYRDQVVVFDKPAVLPRLAASAQTFIPVRRVHQAQRTSEFTFLIEELEVLKTVRSQQDVRQAFKDALETARTSRDQALRLYPSVFGCLWDIKRKGTKIIGYTESMAFYSSYRLKRFGLDGVIDVLFSPEDHDIPPGVSVESVRRLPDEFYQLQVTQVKHTPRGELKPNPRVLLDIINSVGAKVDRCAYVGDSLFKDVAMARDAGVFDLHAAYGESQRRPEYELLRRVSHWTEADVLREKSILQNGQEFEPTAVLRETFAEIFAYCDFESFEQPASVMSRELETQNAVEIWKKCVDVHQHFNDLELRIRNMAITVVGALLAAMSFTYQQGLETTIARHAIPAGVALVIAAIFAWGGFFLMDRYWYHVLLKGAVKHSAKIEKQFADVIPGIALGTTISEESGNVQLFCFKLNSDRRLTLFYALGFSLLLVVFAFLLMAKTNTPASTKHAEQPTAQQAATP